MSTTASIVAYRIAADAHAGQTDKIGAPYIEHPAMVVGLAKRLPGFKVADHDTHDDIIAAAWLRDVIEDTEVKSRDLQRAGRRDRVVDAVVALTRRKDVPGADYYAHIRTLPVALLVKTADIAANLLPDRVALLDEATRVELTAKYAKALDELRVDREIITALHADQAVAPAGTVSLLPQAAVLPCGPGLPHAVVTRTVDVRQDHQTKVVLWRCPTPWSRPLRRRAGRRSPVARQPHARPGMTRPRTGHRRGAGEGTPRSAPECCRRPACSLTVPVGVRRARRRGPAPAVTPVRLGTGDTPAALPAPGVRHAARGVGSGQVMGPNSGSVPG